MTEDETNCYTSVLFTDCKLTDTAVVPEGYNLSVEIIASAIQAEPDEAVETAWPAVVADDTTNQLCAKQGG